MIFLIIYQNILVLVDATDERNSFTNYLIILDEQIFELK